MRDDHTPADARSAGDVQQFYEAHPYPPPLESLEQYQRVWQDPQRRRADHHLFWPDRPFREPFSILVAGCGTSQAAKYAVRWPTAQVTGIDVSATSVRWTEQLKRKHQLNNLQVRQLPIERAAELNTTFDQIVCTGVLHHLSDPESGLTALRDVLASNGAMQVMVYAPYGRTGIYMLQEFCRRLGIRATDDDIRDLITALKALPSGHPLEKLLREAPDFLHEASIADALLHPQDRAYSVQQFFEFLERGRLTFGRWVKQAPYSPQCGAVARLPQASRMMRLSRAQQYAAAELFRGTMTTHSAVVYRNDNPKLPAVSVADDEAWREYVPVRMSDTLCIQERLPPGAAAVLIYPGHTFTDLVMPIDATELSLFTAIDGVRSIGDIIEHRLASESLTSSVDVARRFFERLWWYDQVVFDTSGASR